MLALLVRVLLGEGESEMRRDQFVKGMGAAAGAAFIDPFVLLSQQAQAEINHTRVSSQQVERLAEAAHHHARGFYQLTEEGRLRSLLSDWASTQRLLKLPTTHSQRRELLNVHARLSGILGVFAVGQLHEDRAQVLFETGEAAARESGDIELSGWLYGRLCNAADRRTGPEHLVSQRIVELANAGLRTLGSSTTEAAAHLHGWAARGYAGLGDERATRTHLEDSARILGSATAACWPRTSAMPRSFSYAEDVLLSMTSAAYLRLGDYPAAIAYSEQTAAIYSGLRLSPRTVTPVTSNMIRRAKAMLRAGELDGAVETATVAVRVYEGVALPTLLRRARSFDRELTAAAPGSRYAAEFSELVRSRAT